MSLDLESVPGVASVARRRLGNGELVFAVRDVPSVIKSCSSSEVAVLGVEIFPGLNVSAYDFKVESPLGIEGWPVYVRSNNTLALAFVEGQDQEKCDRDCILTTVSWREFCRMKPDPV